MPNRLRELVIESEFDGSSLDFLPESLETLVIKNSQNDQINLDFLPTNLKSTLRPRQVLFLFITVCEYG